MGKPIVLQVTKMIVDRVLFLMQAGPGSVSFDLKDSECPDQLGQIFQAAGLDVKVTVNACLKTMTVSWE